MNFDLNCDLGEGEPWHRTAALMGSITSANVACGGHAGTSASMERCVELARVAGVRLGAHPGLWSRGDFGRGEVNIQPAELELLLLQQVGALKTVARHGNVPFHHIKLHGALYHATEQDPGLARAYIRVVERYWPASKIYCIAGGRVARLARNAGLIAWEEVFADRLYGEDGLLLPRTEPGAVLTEVSQVLRQFQSILGGKISTRSGRGIPVIAQTICVHSDTPNAAQIASRIKERLRRSWAV
jgi:5-oxoprolinase (ATP-hydrolysing) subunit A